MFTGIHVAKTYIMTVPVPREKAFPLLCPTREYEWLPHWKCQIIHSESGMAELGCVFTTEVPERGQATWILTRHEPPSRVQYTVFLFGSHVWTLDIELASMDAGQCRLTWRHAFTGLTPSGNQFLSEYTDERHRMLLGHIEKSLIHFLRTGCMLKE